MTSRQLENLASIGEIHKEPFSEAEFESLLQSARERLADSSRDDLAYSSRFDLCYNAAHALALAALRFHGYRSSNRFQVFNCLTHTLGLSGAEVRMLGEYHRRRNIAEYEGSLDIDEGFLDEVLGLTVALVNKIDKLE
jgi:hypothetical protein